MQPKNIRTLFQKFAGREVPMEAWETELEGETYKGLRPVNKPDPVIVEMNRVAQDNGLSLEIWNPVIPRAEDAAVKDPSRVHAHIEKGADGKYRVSNKFDIG